MAWQGTSEHWHLTLPKAVWKKLQTQGKHSWGRGKTSDTEHIVHSNRWHQAHARVHEQWEQLKHTVAAVITTVLTPRYLRRVAEKLTHNSAEKNTREKTGLVKNTAKMQVSFKPIQASKHKEDSNPSEEHVRTKHRNTGQNQHQRIETKPKTPQTSYSLLNKKSEQFHIKKKLFQMISEASAVWLLLQEKQTAKALGKKWGEKRKKKKKNKKKTKRKKNIGPYEYANEGIASPPFSQAQWKEDRASRS